MAWWHYLLLVNLYLLLFFGFYTVLLRNETFFQLNRCYLVAGALLSFLIPVIQAKWVSNLFITQQVQHTIYATISTKFIYQIKPVQHTTLTIGKILLVIYIIVAAVLLLRFFYQLLSVKKLLNKIDSTTPFSFFKYIKTNTQQPHTIFEHEQVHARQWHSADILLIEAVMIINWFNPVVYFYRKAIKHVHEFIADRNAIAKGTSKTEYAYLLLSQTFGADAHPLTNNFFSKGLLKQRIMMLNKDESKHRMLFKYGLSVPLFIGMLILSAATVKSSTVIKAINKKTEQLLLINTLPPIQSGQPQQTAAALINQKQNKAENVAAGDSGVVASDVVTPIQNNDTTKLQSTNHVNFTLNKNNQINDTVNNTSNRVSDVPEKRIAITGNAPAQATDDQHIMGKKFFYFMRNNGRDSLKLVYIVNGTEISPEQASTYTLSRLKAINIIKSYTTHSDKPGTMMLVLREDQ